MLLEQGANTFERDKDGNDALHLALKDQQWGIVGVLNDHKNRLWALLRYAFTHQGVPISLIDKAVNSRNVNRRNQDGLTPLHSAVASEAWDIVRVLLNKKADVNLQDRTNQTALLYLFFQEVLY